MGPQLDPDLRKVSGKPGTLVRNFGRAEDVHAVCTGLYPGAVAGGNVLDAQPVSRRQQSGEAQVGRGSGLLSQLAGQFAGIQGDALDAQSLGGFLGGIHNGVIGAQTHHSAHHRKALLL